MASRLILLLTIMLGVVAISATARPCKTIFFITSSTSSSFSVKETPNFPLQNPKLLGFFVTKARQINNPEAPILYTEGLIFGDRRLPAKSSAFHADLDASAGDSSIRDSTLDIMSIVGALLFGVGCGALTAATMYLIWSLFSPKRFDENDYDDDVSAQKMGYMAIPANTSAAVPPAKQVE